MKIEHIVMAAVGVGALGVGAYLIFRPKPAYAGAPINGYVQSQSNQEAQDLAMYRTMAGAAAVAKAGSSGEASLYNQVKAGVFGSAAGAANAILPGAGTLTAGVLGASVKIGESVGSAVVSGLKKLKFW
jgi:hypothetical protein